MRIRTVLFALPTALLACAATLAQPGAASVPAPTTSAVQMTTAARALLAALDSVELAATLFALDAMERSHWSNVPYASHHRPGLRLGGLGREEMLRVHDLLRASLSSQGYQKAAGVMRLDDINRAQQVARLAPNATPFQKAQAESFGSDNYFVLFFGDPRRDSRWGWLLQGHHLAMSFTVADGKTQFLPMFLGATPVAVAEDVETGWSALAQEVTRGVELVAALTESQRKIAISPAAVPEDVLNGVGNKGRFTPAEGLRAADMTPEQRRLLRALVEEYVRNADFDAADEQLAAIEATGWDEVAFTWRGPVGDLAEPFYYRVQGPRISIELRNTADHVHTVTRDPVNDYGEAWLGLTYRETITAAERSAAARRAAE
ncbi:MAG TPA: DUF3500 domain-containing protein [Gammaproteobacteria bacterium]|nr:DUF3500 domain-containing protein [Gammaproteobacteria bacterium]